MTSEYEAVKNFRDNLKAHRELWIESAEGDAWGVRIRKNAQELQDQAEALQIELGSVKHILDNYRRNWIMHIPMNGVTWDALAVAVGNITDTEKLESMDMVLEGTGTILGQLKAEMLHDKEESPKPENGKTVFIIHGHDRGNCLALQRMLGSPPFQLEAVILSDIPGRGRTIITKFEEEAEKAGYAIALFTPDDFVIKPPKGTTPVATEPEMFAQCRPNVLIELGWFYGRMSRERVLILSKRGTKLPTDLEGIERCDFESSVEECMMKLFAELKAIGIIG